MAISRSLSMIFVVAVLVAYADNVAYGKMTGKVLTQTLLQAQAGAGPEVVDTLSPGTVLDVFCRSKSTFIRGDPWWLKVTAMSTGKLAGWVADIYVQCQSAVGKVCNVPVC